jgi:hypothetical protein
MKHVILFDTSGGVKAMHNDSFSLGFLGTQRIERASDIRFDETTQSWGIWFFIDGRFVAPILLSHYGFDSYEAARNKEIQVMNESLLTGRLPTTVQ